MMQIQINSDSNIKGDDKFAALVRNVVKNTLSQFNKRITRLEIHLSDENGPKGGEDDKRCMIEARLNGLKPIAVTHQAATLEQAVDGAANKIKNSIENNLGRMQNRR